MLKIMPSIQTLTDVIGATENRRIHPCDAGQSGNTRASTIADRATRAAENAHPKAVILRGLGVVEFDFSPA
jgi:hypothetical protein